jgi:cysteinyl-tRNA synthetase
MLKVYNTLTRKKEIFKSLKNKKVGMYVCGPTIYGPSHLGHARTYVAFDLIRKYLEYKGYQVKYVMNITDVHDDMIKKAKELGISITELTKKYLPLFHRDMERLRIKKANLYPQVSQHIPEIIKMINTLIKKGYAYQENGSVYYDVSKFKKYGRLSGIKLAQIKTGTRVKTDKYTKKNIADFVLWRGAKPNEPSWSSPWGPGRPGWHIECSVLSQKYLGKQLDIHGGAKDLIFPHHENEIAQSEAATNKRPFVKYWLHSGLLKVNGQKMSKSLGNYIELPDILEKYHPLVVRFFLISKHYRSEINYTKKDIEEAKNGLKRIWEFMDKLNEQRTKKTKNTQQLKNKLEIGNWKLEIEKHMDDDFNTPRALAVVFDLIKQGNKLIDQNKLSPDQAQSIYELMLKFNQVLTVLPTRKKITLPKEIEKLVQQREEARQNKNWQKADQIRNQIEKQGYKIEDTPQGPKIKRGTV